MISALLALTAATILPAAPRILVPGDIDGDGTVELVALLVFSERDTIADVSSPGPGQVEVDVTPSIEERRELWVLRAAGKKLVQVVDPLPVGSELLALAAEGPGAPVWAVLDDGPSLLAFERDEQGAPRRVVFQQVTAAEPLMARSRTLWVDYPLLHDIDGRPPAELLLPVADGILVVGRTGILARLPYPLRETDSGSGAFVRVTLPRIVDVDRDGTADLVDVAGLGPGWSEFRAALRHGLGGFRFSEPTIWPLGSLLEETADERRSGQARTAWDVLDLDGDGKLEFALSIHRVGAETLREGLKIIRGETRRVEIFDLEPDGKVPTRPARSFEIVGHPWWLARPEGWVSPFRDLDGDGRAELLALRVSFGYFGALRALAFGSVRTTLRPEIWSLDRNGSYRPHSDSVPPARFRMNLKALDLSRFRTFPGDIDRDGRLDMVDVDHDEVRISFGRPGPRFDEEPDRVIPLGAEITGFGQIEFLDCDGRGALDLVAYEPQEPESKDAPSRPVRLELFLFDEVRR